MAKFKVVADNISYRLGHDNEEYASISLCTPRPEGTDERYYAVDYAEPSPQVTFYYNGPVSGFPKTSIGDEITISIGG